MTTFMAVLLSVILLFQSTLYSLTRYTGAEAMLKRILDQSAYSVLADFDGRVKNQYGLYMLYQNETSLESKLSAYLKENLKYESDLGLLNIQLQNVDTKEQGFSYLSQLETQILDYCKYRIPLATIEEFLKRADRLIGFLQGDFSDTNWKESTALESYDPKKAYDTEIYQRYDMREDAQDNLKDLLHIGADINKISDSVFRTLPSQKLSATHSMGLEKVLKQFSTVDFGKEEAMDTITDCVNDLSFDGIGKALYKDYIINEYILSTFNSKTDYNREDFYLKWEVEYILCGNPVDEMNAQCIQGLILLVRFLLNTIYIYGQEDMVTTAEIASYLATILVEFQGQPLVKQGILLAWSLMESWYDCKSLERGKKVPVYKTDDTWRYWISYDKDGVEETISLYYKDYLRIFLLLVPREVRLARILDLIQLNESKTNSSFQVLSSVTQLQVTVICYYDDKKRWPLQAEGFYVYS